MKRTFETDSKNPDIYGPNRPEMIIVFLAMIAWGILIGLGLGWLIWG